MLVPMSSERPYAFLVTNGNAFAGRNLANATQVHFRKLRFPGIEQWNGIFAGHREEQLEILAVSERGEQRCFSGRFGFSGAPRLAADRNGRRMKLRADAAGFQYV